MIRERISPKLFKTDYGYAHYCPGCETLHTFAVFKPFINKDGVKSQWTFNGDVNNPTFLPSMNIVGYCHYWLKGNSIEYLDAHHVLHGQTIPLPDIPVGYEDYQAL